MSRKEIYAWCSLGLISAIFIYYLIMVFGLPAGVENYKEDITALIWKVIGTAFLIQLAIDLLNSTKIGGVAKDERDTLIEFKAFRNAYYFLIVALISLIAHVLITEFVSHASRENLFLTFPFLMVHVLVFVLFITILIKSGTQIFYYQRGT
jgi:magnesium-transporting ATPase (P-type)